MIYLIVSFAVCVIFGKLFLSFLTKKGIIQPIYDDALELHKQKQGTPTMGGITFLGTILILLPFVALGNSIGGILTPNNITILLTVTMIILGYGYIGFRDDYLKVMNRRNESGLSPKQKLVLQFIISILVILSLIHMQHDAAVNLGLFTISGLLYYLIVPVMIVGFSNATNLTDGLDGLLSTISIIVFFTLSIIAGSQGNLMIQTIDLLVVGSLLGFLVYNFNPAKMFMGDTGSLVLGVLFTYSILVLKIEILGLLLGAIYIFEVLSVMLQVSYFKYTKKKTGTGKRIFKMAPFHHHLEQSGQNEKQIVLLFASAQLLISLIVLFFYFSM